MKHLFPTKLLLLLLSGAITLHAEADRGRHCQVKKNLAVNRLKVCREALVKHKLKVCGLLDVNGQANIHGTLNVDGAASFNGNVGINGELVVTKDITTNQCINAQGLHMQENETNPCCNAAPCCPNTLWVEGGQPSKLSFTDSNCTDFNVDVTPKDPVVGKWLCQFSGGPIGSGRTTLWEFYVDPVGQLRVHFLAGTQNSLREWTPDDQFPWLDFPQENDLPVTKVGPNSYTIYGATFAFSFIGGGAPAAKPLSIMNSTISLRIQDNNPNLAIWDTIDYAPANNNLLILQQLIRISDDAILPQILVQDPPNADTTNPQFIFNYVFDVLQTQLVQLETIINPSDYPGYPALSAKRNFMLANPIVRQTNIVDVWRTRLPVAYRSTLSNAATPRSTSILMEELITSRAMRLYIEGFEGEYAILNSVNAPNTDYKGERYWKTSIMEGRPGSDLRDIYTLQHYNGQYQKNIVDIDIDTTNLPPYNPAVHGQATLRSEAGPVFPDTEYYDLQGAIKELYDSFGYMTHAAGVSFTNTINPRKILDTFSQVQATFDALNIGTLGLSSRYFWASHTTDFYVNYTLKNGSTQGTLPANEPLGINQRDPQWLNPDNSRFSIVRQNYLDPNRTYSMYWAVDPNSPINPDNITGHLVDFGYLNNGSSFIFTTENYYAPNPDPSLYSIDGGYKDHSIWGIVKSELSGGETIGYIYLDDTLPFDSFLPLASFLPEMMPAGGIVGYSNQLAFYAVALAQLQEFNPSKIIIDSRMNFGGFALFNLASFFGNDRPGILPIYTYADNSYRGLISYKDAAATFQTVFDTLTANLPYGDISGNTTQALYPNSVFKNGTVVVLTDINSVSGGDILPHLFLSDNPNSRDLGNGVTSMIIGDIDGRDAGSSSIDVSTPTNKNQNTTIFGTPIESIFSRVESFNTFQRNGEAPFDYYLANQTPYTEPDTLLNGDISQTAWPDLGYTSPHPLAPLPGWTATGNVQEATDITTVADVAQSLAGKYFFISSPTTNYTVWFKVSGSGVDPAIPGRTSVEVDLITNDSAAVVATKTADALENTGAFTILFPSGNVVRATNRTGGTVLTAPSAQTSGFTLAVVTAGANNVVGQPNPLDHDTWRDSWLEVAIAA